MPSLLALAVLGACAPAIPDRLPLELVHREAVPGEPVEITEPMERAEPVEGADSFPSAERMEGLTFRIPGGDSVTAYLRQPVDAPAEGLAGVILVAGRQAGRRAARVVPGPLEAAVLAVEYPEVLPEEVSAEAFLERLPEIREAALRMPGILVGAAEFLAAEPEVDPDRIALVGVSFGVPFAAAAGDAPIFRGVALHHGGGDLYRLLEANLPVENGLLRAVAARFLGWYLGPLDPARHVDDIGPTPLLLVNGAHDTRVPRESALTLAEEATGPVRQIWLPHDHLMPGDTAVMRELADSTLSHFGFLAPGRGR